MKNIQLSELKILLEKAKSRIGEVIFNEGHVVLEEPHMNICRCLNIVEKLQMALLEEITELEHDADFYMHQAQKLGDDTEYWLMFLKDPATGVIHCSGYGHNAAGDYKNNPYFVGYKKITVDLDTLKQALKQGGA